MIEEIDNNENEENNINNNNNENNNINNNENNNNQFEYESEIKVLDYIWKPQMVYITGHYEFEILLTKKEMKKNKIISQKTIYRRYTDLEILYDGLIKYNPGCLIPELPEKIFWMNVSTGSNKNLLDKRKTKIEKYLNYINKHYYLSKNPVFLIFLSDDFERYKNDLKDGKNLYKLIKNKYNNYMNYVISRQKKFFNIELDDKNLQKEKERLNKILTGINMLIEFLKNEIEQINIQFDSLEEISKISNFFSDASFSLEKKNFSENYLIYKDNLNNESICCKELSKEKKLFYDKINNVYEKIIVYRNMISSLIQIFERKEKFEFELKREKNEDFFVGGNKENEIYELEKNVKNIQKQFYYELNNFHQELESFSVVYLKEFFDLKKELELNQRKIFDKYKFNYVNLIEENPSNNKNNNKNDEEKENKIDNEKENIKNKNEEKNINNSDNKENKSDKKDNDKSDESDNDDD